MVDLYRRCSHQTPRCWACDNNCDGYERIDRPMYEVEFKDGFSSMLDGTWSMMVEELIDAGVLVWVNDDRRGG